MITPVDYVNVACNAPSPLGHFIRPVKIIAEVILTALAVAFILGLCVVAFFAYLFVYHCEWFPYSELGSIDVGNDRTISIYGDTCWEISGGIHYEAREDGKVIVPRTLLRFEDDDFEKYHALSFISAEDQTLVGVFDPGSDSNQLLIIVDFKSGESWPRFADDYEAGRRKKGKFLERLRKENPSLVIPTPFPTVPVSTAIPNTAVPTPTNTLVIQPTSSSTPEPISIDD